jgi:DNA invertase Pin-like site-specific DNA recombinase
MADNSNHSRVSALLRAGVFSRESKGRLKSIDDQDAENLAAATDLGAEVVVTLRDKVSASRFGTKAREGWPEIIDWVTSDRLDILIVWEVSRGDRTMDSFVPFVSACRDHAVLIHVTSEENTYDPRRARDRKALLDAGSDAEYESEKISGRTRKGITGAVLNGKAHGRAAWGYSRRYADNDRRDFTEIPNEHAPLVRELIERVAAHEPISVIAADMEKRGEPTPGGGRWHRSSVLQVVRRPVYAGLRVHKGTLHPGNWEAIVDPDVWRQANAVLDDPARKTTRPGRVQWLLSYVARCEKCKDHLHATPARATRRDGYKCVRGHLGIDAWAVDRYVEELVFARLSRGDAREVFIPDGKAAATARKRLQGIRRELDELADALEKGPENGGISAMLAARSEPGIRKRLGDAEAELKRHNSNSALLALLDAEDIRRAWEDDLSVAARRSVLSVLFKSIWVGPAVERLNRWSTDEDRVRLASERTSVEWV